MNAIRLLRLECWNQGRRHLFRASATTKASQSAVNNIFRAHQQGLGHLNRTLHTSKPLLNHQGASIEAESSSIDGKSSEACESRHTAPQNASKLGHDLLQRIKDNAESHAENLVDDGADLSLSDQFGSTPLILAAGKGQVHLCAKLLSGMQDSSRNPAHVDVNTANLFGSTALMCSSANGHLDVVELLIENGAEINLKTRCGSTALTKAATYGRVEVCRHLIEKGADVSIHNKLGKSAADIAMEKNDRELLALLRASSAQASAV